jgi:hypothetical protein
VGLASPGARLLSRAHAAEPLVEDILARLGTLVEESREEPFGQLEVEEITSPVLRAV